MTLLNGFLSYAPWIGAIIVLIGVGILFFSFKKPCPRCGKRGQGEPYKIVNDQVERATSQDVIDKNFVGSKCRNCGHLLPFEK